MSVLETPRILFRGQIAWDPIVTNNYPQLYDETRAESKLPTAASSQQQVAAFRRQAIDAVGRRGNWNPHGTHRSTFFDTEVTGVDTGGGVDTSDPFVGTPIDFTGMLVDCEPYGADTSQLFFDAMTFGIPGGCRIDATRSTRMIARYINFSRNSFNQMIAGVASVVWQTSFAKADGLALDPHGSPALQALADALDDDDVLGLTVRWNSYRTVYYDDPTLRNGSPKSAAAAQKQVEQLKTGGFQPNPARSLVVGVLGLWRRGEPAQEPGDRPLLAAQVSEVVATAHARLDGQALTIDLANSIAEVDEILTKQNLGTLNVVAVGSDKQVVATLGSLGYHQYDRTAYATGAGIVTLQLDPANVAVALDNDLQVRGRDGTVYLAEAELWPVPTDHNHYLDENDPGFTTAVQLYVRGVPSQAGVYVTMYDASGKTLVKVEPSVATDANGVASFQIAPVAGGGVRPFVFAAGTDPVTPAQLDTQVTPYMYVRTLPADAAIGSLPATWDNVYTGVLANWNAMAPCMDNWLRLDDPAQVQAYAPLIKKLTDPSNFEAFSFMPVTRDMTVGERTLLWNFLDAPLQLEADAESVEAGTPAAPKRDLAKLSRAMRSN